MNIHSDFTFRPGLSAQIVFAAFGAVLALMISSSVLASDETPEVRMAAVHAGLAASSDDVSGVHMHLHHALNCLVGPDGQGFDADEMNPCEDMGNGAIPATEDRCEREQLEKIAGLIERGIDNDDYEEARKIATSALDRLEAERL